LYSGVARAEKIPARKIAIKNDRIMDKNSAEIDSANNSRTDLFNVSRFIIRHDLLYPTQKSRRLIIPALGLNKKSPRLDTRLIPLQILT
jgi:hypothetical protein